MGLNSRASVGPDTQSLGVASMPIKNRKTNQKQTKQPQNQTKTNHKQTTRKTKNKTKQQSGI
jgi:hypothetical protein